MKCEYCGREDCPAQSAGGPSVWNAAYVLRDCLDATRDRALRAEAEANALASALVSIAAKLARLTFLSNVSNLEGSSESRLLGRRSLRDAIERDGEAMHHEVSRLKAAIKAAKENER